MRPRMSTQTGNYDNPFHIRSKQTVERIITFRPSAWQQNGFTRTGMIFQIVRLRIEKGKFRALKPLRLNAIGNVASTIADSNNQRL